MSRITGEDQPMSDEESVRRTLALYCQLCDDGRFDEWADLYTDDARFSVLGGHHDGRAAIRAFIEAGQPPERRGKHVCANPVVEVRGDEASARTDYVFVARADGGFAITSAGRYHDRLVRDGDRWRFAERRIVFLGEEA
jgi:3-phenylpropionate/cinnamic acid dioxygenase small subunit